jgi:hypothetical protein
MRQFHFAAISPAKYQFGGAARQVVIKSKPIDV